MSHVPQVPQSAMLHLLGMAADGAPKAQENMGWPTFGVPMAEALVPSNDLGMSAILDPALVPTATGGYSLPAHVTHHSGPMDAAWNRHPSQGGDSSDGSRPGSACSESSLSSSDGSYA